jgi:hypothetical protein
VFLIHIQRGENQRVNLIVSGVVIMNNENLIQMKPEDDLIDGKKIIELIAVKWSKNQYIS